MASSITLRSPQTSSRRALIYFIPGNPGLIQFYRSFLTLLSSLLPPSSPSNPSITDSIAYDIYGQDLLGFTDSSHAPFSATNPPFNLEAQIQQAQETIEEKGRGYDFVVVMGHSVGAYIAVETFSRWSKLWKAGKKTEVEIVNGVLLFPTLIHIAQSPSGRKLVGLSKVDFIAENAHLVPKALLWLVPMVVLRWFLGNVMRFTAEAADVTSGWLKSRDGIRQALYLGLDEMRTIKDNVWEDDIWEASTPVVRSVAAGSARFYFFYAEDDHWVDTKGRDEFVGEFGGSIRVRVEGGGVRHAFCTKKHDSWIVAKSVAEWFEEIDAGERSLG